MEFVEFMRYEHASELQLTVLTTEYSRGRKCSLHVVKTVVFLVGQAAYTLV